MPPEKAAFFVYTTRLKQKDFRAYDNLTNYIKTLPEKEKTWVLLDNDYVEVKDKKGNLLYKTKSCIDEFPYMLTDNDGKKTRLCYVRSELSHIILH